MGDANSPDPLRFRTTLLELLTAITDSTSDDAEALAVALRILGRGRRATRRAGQGVQHADCAWTQSQGEGR